MAQCAILQGRSRIMNSSLQRICVFCGSRPGERPEYLEAGRALGSELARRGLGLVYGGAKVGVMGAVAATALEGGAEVIGVIPKALMRKEVAHDGLSDLRIVGSMHERKQQMADLADGFVALPGGLGTLEELFETLTWGQLGMHGKPCGLLNAGGYFGRLLEFLDHAVAEGFVPEAHRAMILVGSSPARLLDGMDAYRPPRVQKWLEREEA
jgi:uncharacterized protein (TIGR00730 family)